MTSRILVCDDDQDQLVILAHLLKGGAFEVVQTDCPMQAVTIAAAGGFSAVICDYRLPGTVGTNVLDAVRRYPWWNETIALILLTAGDKIDENHDGMIVMNKSRVRKELLKLVSDCVEAARLSEDDS